MIAIPVVVYLTEYEVKQLAAAVAAQNSGDPIGEPFTREDWLAVEARLAVSRWADQQMNRSTAASVAWPYKIKQETTT